MSSSEHPIYEPGDVVYGADPFKGVEATRPWLILSNHEDRPFHGEQYVGLTLTTRSWLDGLIPIRDEDWIEGGTPEESRVVPWGVQSLTREDIDRWQGRVSDDLRSEAVDALVASLRS